MLPRLMTKEDPDVSDMIAARWKEEGIDLRLCHRAARIEGNTLVCEHEGREVAFEFDRLLCYDIRDAIDKKRSVFDFLRGNETYKYRMGAIDTQVFKLKAKM